MRDFADFQMVIQEIISSSYSEEEKKPYSSG